MKHLAGRERSDSCASAGELEGSQGRAGSPAVARHARGRAWGLGGAQSRGGGVRGHAAKGAGDMGARIRVSFIKKYAQVVCK